jgi:8-oxo-dGTP pyrophosphatase MutT (NUDIX family)
VAVKWLPALDANVPAMLWKPNVTVAAVLERDGKFLLVEEETSDGIRYNQPAGHLECGESLFAAAIRETLEETAYTFVPQYLVGIYHWRHEAKAVTYMRFAFGGEITGHDPLRPLDKGIIAAHWLRLDEIRALEPRHRSPLILRCIEDWRIGKRYPLELIMHYAQMSSL